MYNWSIFNFYWLLNKVFKVAQVKYLLIDNKKHEDGFKVIAKLACDKDTVAVAEYNASFPECDHSTYQECQQSLVILITQANVISIIPLQIYQQRW